MGRVAGKVAFITGAGQGQGRWHAVRLAEEGADIIATDMCKPYPDFVRYKAASAEDLDETRKLVEKTGRRCITAVADVQDRAALQSAVDKGIAEFGRLDIVCANAGAFTLHMSSLDIPDEEFDYVIATNLKGVWNTIQGHRSDHDQARQRWFDDLDEFVGGYPWADPLCPLRSFQARRRRADAHVRQ